MSILHGLLPFYVSRQPLENGDVTHLNRLVGGDEWKHEMEARAAGAGQESPSSAFMHTCTENKQLSRRKNDPFSLKTWSQPEASTNK